nr:hypothetical protein [Elizabethkingia sp. ASV34]
MNLSNKTAKNQKREIQGKKKYLSPCVKVESLAMEEGVASGSASVVPATIDGKVTQIPTSWEGEENTNIDTY